MMSRPERKFPCDGKDRDDEKRLGLEFLGAEPLGSAPGRHDLPVERLDAFGDGGSREGENLSRPLTAHLGGTAGSAEPGARPEASAPASPGATSTPATPSSTKPVIPPRAEPTTGRPAAIASSTTVGQASSTTDGTTTRRAARMRATTSCGAVGPSSSTGRQVGGRVVEVPSGQHQGRCVPRRR